MLINNRIGIIYKATCTETGLAYVGQTTKPLAVRKEKHSQRVSSGSDTPFHQAISEYGEDAFVWEVLAEGIPQAQLGEKEQFYIDLHDTFDNGYNANRGGGGKRATPQLQPCVRFVSESELVFRWDLNRGYNEEHAYALARDMQAIGGFDADYPIGTIEIEGELHIYSGHHRAEAAFSRDITPYQFYPLLPLQKVPVTVIKGDEDMLIDKMWTTHIISDSEDCTLGFTGYVMDRALGIALGFPHYYRLSPRKLSNMWKVPAKYIRSVMVEVMRDISNIPYQKNHLISSERAMAIKRLTCIRNADYALRGAFPTPPEIPESRIQWFNECLTIALPKSTDRLAVLHMLLKRLAEDL